jgi:hypothetical protein
MTVIVVGQGAAAAPADMRVPEEQVDEHRVLQAQQALVEVVEVVEAVMGHMKLLLAVAV